MTNSSINSGSRRTFLRGVGAAVALPYLESLADPIRAFTGTGREVEPMRMVCIGLEYSIYPGAFFPQEVGRDYTMPAYLKPLEGIRDQFTVFSHLDHPGVKGGHDATHSFLSGIRREVAAGHPDGNITIDQVAAEFIGANTRFSSLQLNTGGANSFGGGISWTRNGVAIPPMTNLQEIFDTLFSESPESQKQRLAKSYKLNTSILDVVHEDAKSLRKRLAKSDQQKLDEYFYSVRNVEKRLAVSEQWLDRAKPVVDYRLPDPLPRSLKEEIPLYFDLMGLALQTDSTRVLTYDIVGWKEDSGIAGVEKGYHDLTHHGKDPSKLSQLMLIEGLFTSELARFLKTLRKTQIGPEHNLLDKTMVLFGSGLGNASSHSNRDLPILLAGGGLRHGEHRDYPKTNGRQTPLCNLYLTMLQNFGMEINQFGTSSGALSELS